MDHAAWLAQGLGDEDEARETYRHWMRVDPDMREYLGPIKKQTDPHTGRMMRTREARVAMMRGSENLKEVTVYLDPLPHIRLEKGKDLQGWYSGKGDGDIRGKRERPCMTDAVLTEPYGGYCTVGCTFCYINSGVKGYRGSGLVTVPMAYGDQVRRQLASMQTSAAGYFSSFTDPFLPLEDYYHNTEQGARAFVEAGLPIFFLSRLPYPGWAFDLLAQNPLSYAQKSLNTPNEDDWRKLSPGAASLAAHMEQIRELSAQGTYVSIQVNPIVPGIVTHEDVEELFGMLAQAGADHVIVKFVEANYPWAKAMVERVTKRFGANRAAEFRDLFVENSAGQQRTVAEAYRLDGHRRYQRRATALGMTYATCYEYRRLEDGRHASIGPEFTTADQCHGHRVPMHVRASPGTPFAALGVCPPSGCLACSSHTADKKPACGSDLLGAAKALRLPDLRKDPGVTTWR